jgi:hypothetical protein
MGIRASLLVLILSACGSVTTKDKPDASQSQADGPTVDMPAGATALLSVGVAGGGAATITSSPAGIDCGSDCSETYPVGTDVVLTATAERFSAFTGWSGGGCSGTGPCTVHVGADTPVIANVASHCDSFTHADGTTIPGWTERTGDWSIVGNAIQHPETGGVYTNHITNDGSMQTDGCVRLKANLGAGPANIQAVGAVLRWTAGPSYVVALIQNNSGTNFNQTYIYQYPGGSSLANGVITDYGLAATVEACVAGTTVTLTIDTNNDGTPESTLTGTTTLTGPGLSGVMTHSFGAPSTADDFCWGP